MWEEEARSEEEADGAANGGANSADDVGGQCHSGDGCGQEVLRVLPGWHFISAKQFYKGNYKAYPVRNCRGNAPGLGAQSASASASASATATATSTALASTGGPALALPATLAATVGLVGSGLVALRTVLRRGGASS